MRARGGGWGWVRGTESAKGWWRYAEEENREAVAVTERDTAETKLLKLSQETAAKCEVLLLLLLHVPQASKPLSPPLPLHIHRTIATTALCSAAAFQLRDTHTRTHAQPTHTLKVLKWSLGCNRYCGEGRRSISAEKWSATLHKKKKSCESGKNRDGKRPFLICKILPLPPPPPPGQTNRCCCKRAWNFFFPPSLSQVITERSSRGLPPGGKVLK